MQIIFFKRNSLFTSVHRSKFDQPNIFGNFYSHSFVEGLYH
ncbi:hypothetical protein CNEO4_1240054 [Clostridium neonatale]|nr:hypothetical protein CNEO4_1240054 [Clostridium neonatale]